MNKAERDKAIYYLARDYLLQLEIKGVTSGTLDKYLTMAESRPRPASVAGIYESILESAQNANMKASVIGGAIGGIDKLSVVLCDFQPKVVLETYPTWESVLDEVVARLNPAGKIRRTARSLWPHYCRTILSAAQFMAQFSSADEFYHWVDFFDTDDRARPGLPMLLDNEVEGFGFALACDFLKELGYVNFAKPDVHLRDIFTGLRLCHPKVSDYQMFKAIIRVAKNAQVTPYNADKLFWLIGSGFFYDDPGIGVQGKIGSHKAEFISWARKQLNEAAD